MKIFTFKEDLNNLYPVGSNIKENNKYLDRIILYLLRVTENKPFNIWCMGSSGAILSALLLAKLNKNYKIIHVKKEGEKSHLTNYTYAHNEINIILDDFHREGNTLCNIWQTMHKYVHHVDVLILYNNHISPRWDLPFIPKVLITGKNSISNEWKNLSPERKIKPEEELISF